MGNYNILDRLSQRFLRGLTIGGIVMVGSGIMLSVCLHNMGYCILSINNMNILPLNIQIIFGKMVILGHEVSDLCHSPQVLASTQPGFVMY